jgi:hypothetical protein
VAVVLLLLLLLALRYARLTRLRRQLTGCVCRKWRMGLEAH